MAYSDADIIQWNQGSTTAVTLPSGTTVGNTLKIFAAVGGGTFSTTQTGFTRDAPSTSGAAPGSVWTKAAVAGETSWTIALSVTGPVAWIVMELPGTDWSVDVTQTGTTSSLTSTTTALTSTYDGMAIVLHSAYNSTGGVAATIGSQTGGFEEFAEQTASDGTKAIVLALSRKYVQSLATQQSTATASGTTPTSVGSTILVLSAPGARRAADVRLCAGFNGPSAAALASGIAASTYVDTVTGSPAIGTGDSVLGGNYLELSATAAAEWVGWTSPGALAGFSSTQVARLSLRFPTALPGADLDLFNVGTTQFRYRAASQKIGVQVGSGTEQLSDATVAADSRISIDWRRIAATTTHTMDWQVTYADGGTPVAQAQATGTGTAGNVATLSLGWTTALTGTVRYTDVVASAVAGHHPLGDMRIYPLKVDPAGTLTISGTAGNFQTFAGATPTMTAWNATTARGAIDDVPPGLGASADGIAQITAAATDYVAIPMQTLDLASIPGSIRGVRMCFAGWAASATAATISFRSFDGTTEYTHLATTDVNGFDNTNEKWVCKMVRPTSARVDWTQAKLDALTARVGFSDDATPDIGIHALLGEAVVRMTETLPLFGDGASQARDPDSAGVQAIAVTAPAMGTGDTVLEYQESGAPTTVTVPEGTTVTEPIGAPDERAVNRITVFWPPEPDPVA